MKHLYFLFFNGCEGLSFAGPQQAFHEAIQLGAAYRLHHCALTPSITTEQGLTVSGLDPLPEPRAGDTIFVAGYTPDHVAPPQEMIAWLRKAGRHGPTIVAVCSGAFFLGYAGLLDGLTCTTHWKRYEQLQRTFPKALVQKERLFCRDGNIWTSGGGASSIDLALDIIDADCGPLMAARIAHEMVVFFRRDASSAQTSVYLDYRSHLNPAVHNLQDLLSAQPEDDRSLDEWARTVGMSPRNLTRAFRQATGISVAEYRTRLRLERAKGFLQNPGLTVDEVASRCGFADGRHLRRLWKKTYGVSPKASAVA